MNADLVGRITSTGELIEYPLGTSGAFAAGITAGPDRTLWLALNQANAVACLTLNGTVSLIPLSTGGAAPVGIAAGPDGAVCGS